MHLPAVLRVRASHLFGLLCMGLLLVIQTGCGGGGGDGGGGTTTPAAKPVIVLSSSAVSFTAQSGAAAPAAQGVNISNGTADAQLRELTSSITYGAGQTPGWLNASLSGTVAPTTLSLSANPGSLAAGTYTATVTVFATGASNSPQSVNVTLTVTAPQATIVLGAAQAAFTTEFGAASPAAQQVSVSSGSGSAASGLTASISYTAGQPTGWLATALSSSTAPATLTLTPSTSTLPIGSYSATVSVAATNASNSPQTLAVTVTVAPAKPRIDVNSTAVAVSARYQSTTSVVRTVAVTNGGGGSLTGLSVAVAYTQNISPWLTATLDASVAPATLTLTVPPMELLGDGAPVPGTYTATVVLVAATASNSPKSISVTLTVTAPPPEIQLVSLEPQPPNLSGVQVTFSSVAGGASPAAKTVGVEDRYANLPGGIPLTGLGITLAYLNGQSWLSATLDNSTAPAMITLRPNTAGLAAGVYQATVSVTSAVASNSPQVIYVKVTVGPALVPTVVSSSPTANATGVGVESYVEVTFSADMNPITINESSFFLLGQVGPPPLSGNLPAAQAVPGTVTYDAPTRTARFTPTNTWLLSEFSSVYEVHVSLLVTDVIGTRLDQDVVFNFTTVDFDPNYTYRIWSYARGSSVILATASTPNYACGMLATAPTAPHLDRSVWYFDLGGYAPGTYQLHNYQFDNVRALTVSAIGSPSLICRMDNTIGGAAGAPSAALQEQLWTFIALGSQKYRIQSFRNGSSVSLSVSAGGDALLLPTSAADVGQQWTVARRARRN